GGGLELRVFGLERPADERGESLRLILLHAQPFQVFDAVFNRLDMTEHHRRAGIQSQPVRHIHDFKPVIAHGLERRDFFADTVHQNFAAAAGNRAEAGGLEIADYFLQRLVEYLAEVDELAGTETVDVDLGKLAFDVREQIQIPLLRQLWMMPALHQNLRAAQRDRLLDFFVHLLESDDISIVVLFHTVERAELAIDIADVGVIDVAVNDVGDDFVAATVEIIRLGQLTAAVGQRAEFLERQMIKPQRFALADALAIPDFLQQLVQ